MPEGKQPGPVAAAPAAASPAAPAAASPAAPAAASPAAPAAAVAAPAAAAPAAPPAPTPPARPGDPLKTLSTGISTVAGLPSKPVEMLNEGFAVLTAPLAAVLPSFPAATLGCLALGLPHAHPAHPPSGPPPVPPTPIPPMGPILFGCCVSVLIGGMPAARAGDLGLSATCCGLPPVFEVFTGSSKVFIGGSRAARMLDMTFHCKPTPPAGAAKRGMIAAMQKAAGAATAAAGKAAKVAGALNIAGDAANAVAAAAAGDAAAAAAQGMAAGVAAAQMAADAIAMAMGAAMGKDPTVPPGTLGAITNGVPTVLIGGFPMPSWTEVAKGLGKLAKGIRRKVGSRGRGSSGRNH
jgi:uncharacterized Zn-binding protein involved in type VI secretion